MAMRTRFLVLLGLVVALGCGSSKSAPVSGTITMDGQPLAHVAVSFQPEDEGKLNTGVGSYAQTDDQGKYSLKLIGGGTGAVVGKHRVQILPVVEDNSTNDRVPQPKLKIPMQYNSKTQLTYEVKPGSNTDANFDLSSHPAGTPPRR
jgi:hypothetical protein